MGIIMTVVQAIITFFATNIFAMTKLTGLKTAPSVLLFIVSLIWILALMIKPTVTKKMSKRIKILTDGARLLVVFLISVTASAGNLFYLIYGTDFSTSTIVINTIIIAVAEFFVFWAGMIRLYTTSTQLGIKWRAIGWICGLIPIVHIFVLLKMIRITTAECKFEEEKLLIDNGRVESEICKTRYPMLLVHGVFFRDSRFFNYWGRVPNSLKRNGATLFYGEQKSADSVENSARQLADKIEKIVAETGCEKVNIIAHSKGGLDSRYAISCLDCADKVASLTTINTPHEGCAFAEYLLNKAPEKVQNTLANSYNTALRKTGEEGADFLKAVESLTVSQCKALDEKMPDMDNVFYQSVASCVKKSANGQFPLNFSYHLVNYFDGPNDGLVSLDSQKRWGCYAVLTPEGNRGITHGDVIDLNRENIDKFDVREFYVGLVSDLKNKGY